MKRILLFFLFIISAVVLRGQEMPSVVPPAPEAASLGKYTDMPVNYSSGLPQISIPMFTASSRDISVPVSLSYHAGGIRVEEIASRTGLGWNLQAGGSVTRSVRGIADDGPFGWLNPAHTVSDFENATDLIGQPNNKTVLSDEVLAGQNDYQPDVFNFSYPGGSGKFFFDESGNIVTVPASEVKITYSMSGGNLAGISQFIITDTRGYQFHFGQYGGGSARDITGIVQSFEDNSNAEGIVAPPDKPLNHYSTWYLLAILSPVSDAIVTFSYTTQSTTSLNRGSETSMFEVEDFEDCALPVSLRTSYIRSDNTEILLNGIVFENGVIGFEYDSTSREDLPGSLALSKVILKDKDFTPLRTFDLVQGYWTSTDHSSTIAPFPGIPKEHLTKRMYLEKIIETGENNSDPKEYLFDYHDSEHMPNRFSHAQDVWGFYNGANDNTSLIPQHFERGEISPTPVDELMYVIPGANRRSEFDKAKIYSLKSITYPTGGTAHLDYESNGGVHKEDTPVYYANSFFETVNDNLAIYHYNNTINYTELQFTVDESHLDGTLRFTYDVTGCSSGEEGPGGIVVCGLAATLEGVTNTSYTRNLSLQNGAYFNVAPGTYKLKLQIEDPSAVTDAHATITAFQNASPYAQRGEYAVGGLRILRTTMDDSFGNKLIKEYSYIQNEMNTKPDEYKSSGLIANQKWKFHDDQVGYCINPAAIATQQTSQSLITATGTGTGHITYSKVIEAQIPDNILLGATSGTVFPNGFTVHEYDFIYDEPNTGSEAFPYTPYRQYEWMRGNLQKQSQVENKNGKFREVQSKTLDIEYSILYSDPYFKEVKAIKVDKRGSHYIYSYYYIYAGANHVLKETTRTVQSNGEIEESVDYEYNTNYLRPDKTISNHSDGQKTISQVKYTDDSFGNELTTAEKTVLANMVSANMLVPVLTEAFADNVNTPKGKSLTVFGDLTAGYLPVATKIWNHDTDTYEQRLEYSYTDEGNYEHLIKDGAQEMAFIWNYKNTRPTAQITNVSDVNDIAYTSFEAEGKGNWTYTGASVAGTDLPSGNKYTNIDLGNVIMKTQLNSSKTYIVSFWAKDGVPTVSHVLSNNDASGPNAFGWTYYEKLIGDTDNILISGTAKIDELRLFPTDSQMSTYTYNPLRGVTTMGSPNNLFSHYEYDEHGRLKYIKDQDGNVLKMYEYKFKQSINN